MGYTCGAEIIFKSEKMIVYKRSLQKKDVQRLEDDEELIYYYSNNIAYTIVSVDNKYVVRKKKVFNNQMIEEKFVKTIEQIIKMVQ